MTPVTIHRSVHGITVTMESLDLAAMRQALIRYAVQHADTLESAASTLGISPAALAREAATQRIPVPPPARPPRPSRRRRRPV